MTVWCYFRAENPPTRAAYDILDKEDVGEDGAVVNIVIGSDYLNETGTYYIGLYYDRNLNGKKLFSKHIYHTPSIKIGISIDFHNYKKYTPE